VATTTDALLADYEGLGAAMGIRPQDRLVAAIPFSHAYGLSTLLLAALVRGNLLIVPDGPDPFRTLTAAHAGEATVLPTVPAYLRTLLQLDPPPALPRSLRLIVSAGARLVPETAAASRERWGLPVHSLYGSTECGGICYDREGGAGERGTVGTPVEGVRVTLGRVEAPAVEAAEEGVVRVASPAVADGYLPEPEARLGGGRFTTGDLAAWKGGELELRGRVDDLINIKGKKVNPREVEAVLARLPGVDEVAVLALPLPGAAPVLRAAVGCREGGLSRAAVLAWCRAHLAPHKVPRSLLLLAELPRTPRGKLDRQALLAARSEEGERGTRG
jgi:long-chain acyl-CoA synthetase